MGTVPRSLYALAKELKEASVQSDKKVKGKRSVTIAIVSIRGLSSATGLFQHVLESERTGSF